MRLALVVELKVQVLVEHEGNQGALARPDLDLGRDPELLAGAEPVPPIDQLAFISPDWFALAVLRDTLFES